VPHLERHAAKVEDDLVLGSARLARRAEGGERGKARESAEEDRGAPVHPSRFYHHR
jgi:hypothetical protein